MTKRITALFLALILFFPTISLAVEIPGYEGGINNENNYKEVIFITGHPIEMEGSLTIRTNERSRGGVQQINHTYTYRLNNIREGASLNRTIRLTETFQPNGRQTTSQKTLDSYSERLNIDGRTYQVNTEDYQWNQGQLVHETGLVDYIAGDWSARKTYKLGARRGMAEEEISVQTIGKLVGYDSPWSATQTQTLHYIIDYENKLEEDDNWQGTATVEASYNKTKDYNYVENVPNQISFRGGFILTEKHDNLLKYSYDLPREGRGRNLGQASMTIDTNPLITRLNIPALRDVRGLASEKDILLVASMDGFSSLDATNLGPYTAVSRGDFAKALVNTMDIEIPETDETTSKRGSRQRNEKEEEASYIDVGKNHRNYSYIEGVSNRDIMLGVGKGRFEPDRELTKAEATTILIRLLGFQNLAPIGNYSTGFMDDSAIPAWAKDHVYMARELNIIPRTAYFNPNQAITKEETAVLLVNFINYLQNNLRYDYREGIVN